MMSTTSAPPARSRATALALLPAAEWAAFVAAILALYPDPAEQERAFAAIAEMEERDGAPVEA